MASDKAQTGGTGFCRSETCRLNEGDREVLETQIAEIDLDTLVKRVRQELERLGEKQPSLEPLLDPAPPKPQECHQDLNSPPPADSTVLPCPQQLPCAPAGSTVDYKTLDAFWGPHFVEQAYRAVLGRPPDAEGATHYTDALLSGRLTKAEVVAQLRRSAEGRTHRVRIRGLLPALAGAVWRKIPGIGKLFRRLDALEHSVASVPMETFRAMLRRLESYQNTMMEAHNVLAAHLREVVHPRLQALDSNVEALDGTLRELHGRVTSLDGSSYGFRENVLRRLEHLQDRLDHLLAEDLPGHLHNHAQAIALLRAALADHQRQHTPLVEWRTSRPSANIVQQPAPRTTSNDADPEPCLTEERHRLMDALYTSLEDAFRGPVENIRERLRFYLPYLRTLPLDLVPTPVVDAGCGRGEWLELLQSEGVQAIGVDMNPVMVARCCEKRLAAVEDDAIHYLQSLASGCVGAVTAFQLIEHLGLEDLIRFLDAAYQALAPGGMLLCETPNPENLLVSSYSFYLDPTHRHPIPPPVAVFLLESRGFCDVAVVRPPRVGRSGPEVEKDLPSVLRKLLFCEEDYAVIGYKPPCRHDV